MPPYRSWDERVRKEGEGSGGSGHVERDKKEIKRYTQLVKIS